MQKDLTFLATDGKLTMSSAAHLRDLAALSARRVLNKLNSLRFVNEHIQLIGTKEKHQTVVGNTADEVLDIPRMIQQVVDYQAFEAWMNEAIEAKKTLYKEIKDMSVEKYVVNVLNEEMPTLPEKQHIMDEDDYLATLSVKDRNRYFTLQTTVAALGRVIHKDGSYDRAIVELNNSESNPIREETNGRDTLFHIFSPSVDKAVIDEVFFKLQNQHREAQAQLNGMKDAMLKAIKDDDIAKNSIYREECAKVNAKVIEYNNMLTRYKQLKSAEYDKLKIIVPNNLELIYRELSALGK